MDWLLAGYNREDDCLVGIHDVVYDLTDFLEMHPGSKETILLHGGSDATRYFDDVGHSMHARERMKAYRVINPNPQVHRCLHHKTTHVLRQRKLGIEGSFMAREVIDGFTHKILEPLKELATHLPNVGGFDVE